MRADRLLSLLMLLQARGRMSARALAAESGVSMRTVYRDVAALEQSGIPVVVECGRHGGIHLMEGYQSRLTGLSMPEAEALPFTQSLMAATALGLGAAARTAHAKTIAALPRPMRDHAVDIAARFHFDPVDWYARLTTPTLLRAVADATWSNQVIAIDYESWRARGVRVVEPLGIVCKAANWYMVARRKKRFGIYRIESIHAVRVVGGRKVNRRNFNLPHVWNQEVTRFEAGLRRQRACLRISPNAMSGIHILGADAAETICSTPPGKDGWRTSEVWIESVSHAATQLLAFAGDVEAVSPVELRGELAGHAARILAMYKR